MGDKAVPKIDEQYKREKPSSSDLEALPPKSDDSVNSSNSTDL